MTEGNKRENIKIEIDKAAEILAEADILYNSGFSTGAVSRLYYCLLHSIKALLLSKGLEPKSHEGVLRLFGLHFVKENIFEAATSHTLAKLMKYREEADYNPSYTFTKDDFISLRTEALDLSEKIKNHLMEKGYL